MLSSRLPQIAAAMEPKAEAVIAKAAHDIARNAKELVPVESGDLRDSIEPREVAPLHWEVEAGEYYASFVEFGTHLHGGPRPFMVPAAERVRGELASMLREIV